MNTKETRQEIFSLVLEWHREELICNLMVVFVKVRLMQAARSGKE